MEVGSFEKLNVMFPPEKSSIIHVCVYQVKPGIKAIPKISYPITHCICLVNSRQIVLHYY